MRLFAMLLLAAATACTGAPAPSTTPDEPKTDGAGGDEAGGDASGTADAQGETKDDTDAAAAAADTDAAEGTGEAVTLSLEQFTEAAGKVRPMMDKTAAIGAIKPILGEPTSASDEELVWVGKIGASECKALKVQMMGAFTGTVSVDDSDCPAGSAE